MRASGVVKPCSRKNRVSSATTGMADVAAWISLGTAQSGGDDRRAHRRVADGLDAMTVGI
jgi:hypothetical protein